MKGQVGKVGKGKADAGARADKWAAKAATKGKPAVTIVLALGKPKGGKPVKGGKPFTSGKAAKAK